MKKRIAAAVVLASLVMVSAYAQHFVDDETYRLLSGVWNLHGEFPELVRRCHGEGAVRHCGKEWAW